MTTNTEEGVLVRRYQFQIDGRGFGARVHTEWALAANDAVAAGYGFWASATEVKLDEQASIAEW